MGLTFLVFAVIAGKLICADQVFSNQEVGMICHDTHPHFVRIRPPRYQRSSLMGIRYHASLSI